MLIFFEITMLVALLVKYGSGADCPLMYRSVGSVCGTDGVTYPTLCEMEVARIFDDSLDISYFGNCVTYCKNNWNPVCGTDLHTYPNVCELEQASRKYERLEILHLGQCQSGDQEDDGYDKKKRYAKLINRIKSLINGTNSS